MLLVKYATKVFIIMHFSFLQSICLTNFIYQAQQAVGSYISKVHSTWALNEACVISKLSNFAAVQCEAWEAIPLRQDRRSIRQVAHPIDNVLTAIFLHVLYTSVYSSK